MPDPTDTEILSALKSAYLAVLTGKSYAINGRVLTRVDERWLSDEIQRYEARGAAASDQTAGFGVASFGEPW